MDNKSSTEWRLAKKLAELLHASGVDEIDEIISLFETPDQYQVKIKRIRRGNALEETNKKM